MEESRGDVVKAVAMALLLHVALLVVLFLGLLPEKDTRGAAPQPMALQAGLIDLGMLPAMPGGSPKPEMPIPQTDTATVPDPPSPPVELAPVEPQPSQENTVDPDASEPRPADNAQASVGANSTSDAAFEGVPYSDEDRRRRILALRKASREYQDFTQDTYASGRIQKPIRLPSPVVVRVTYPQGNDAVEKELLVRYQAELQEALLDYWVRPDTVHAGQSCHITIEQLPGGEVVDVRVDETCPFDELGRQSLVAAVQQAQPLPYAGYESVVSPSLSLDIEALDR